MNAQNLNPYAQDYGSLTSLVDANWEALTYAQACCKNRKHLSLRNWQEVKVCVNRLLRDGAKRK